MKQETIRNPTNKMLANVPYQTYVQVLNDIFAWRQKTKTQDIPRNISQPRGFTLGYYVASRLPVTCNLRKLYNSKKKQT